MSLYFYLCLCLSVRLDSISRVPLHLYPFLLINHICNKGRHLRWMYGWKFKLLQDKRIQWIVLKIWPCSVPPTTSPNKWLLIKHYCKLYIQCRDWGALHALATHLRSVLRASCVLDSSSKMSPQSCTPFTTVCECICMKVGVIHCVLSCIYYRTCYVISTCL